MPPTFPCPNPTCTHTFAPEAVKGVSSLKCPKCGTVFQFGPSQSPPARSRGTTKAPAAAVIPKPSGAPPKAPPPIPKAAANVPPPRPAPPPPLAVPVAPVAHPAAKGVPLAAPIEAVQTPAALNFNSAPDMVVPPGRRRAETGRKKRLTPLLAIVAVVAVGIGVAVWGGMWLIHWNKTESTYENPLRGVSQSNNFRFSLPGKPWRRDTSIELKLHVNLGMRSPERNNCMGLFFKDYKTRLPSDAEMVDEALTKLRAYFQGVEWERKPRDDKITLGGRPALSLEFVGEDSEHVPMNGECYMTAYHGFAYWFFTWAPDDDNKDTSRAQWEGLRERFAVLDARKGWTEKPPETEKVQGKKAKYQLTYVKGLWTRKSAPEDYDPLADLVLQGDEPDPSRKTHSSKRATFQLLVLPKQENLQAAVAAARAYVLTREKAEYPKTTSQPIKDKNGGEVDRATDSGNEHGHLSKLDVQNTEDLRRFLVLAVVNRPEGVLLLVGDCLWERRDFWDQEFTPLLKSLKVR